MGVEIQNKLLLGYEFLKQMSVNLLKTIQKYMSGFHGKNATSILILDKWLSFHNYLIGFVPVIDKTILLTKQPHATECRAFKIKTFQTLPSIKMAPSRSRERTFEREGTLDKLSELHTITRHTAG